MGHAFPPRPGFRYIGLVVLACISLTGCGRRGSLEPPPASPLAQRDATSAAQQARVLNDQDQPGLIQSPNKFYEEPAAEKLERQQRQAAASGAPRAINAPPDPKRGTFPLDPLL